MAETVHYYLESMLPELKDMEKRKIFTKEEITQIVKKRTDYEYSLKRRETLKSDFLKYLEYEMNLEQLKKARRKKLGLQNEFFDTAGTRHMGHIFERAILKFPSDLLLWIEYIKFCQSQGSYKKAGRLFARALQYHTRNPLLWILASQWEMEQNHHIDAARKLLQRALRFITDDVALWVQYFKVEVYFVLQILERRQLLGIKKEESSIQLEALAEEEEPIEQKEELVKEVVLEGAILKTVYKNALKELKPKQKRDFQLELLDFFNAKEMQEFKSLQPISQEFISLLEQSLNQ